MRNVTARGPRDTTGTYCHWFGHDWIPQEDNKMYCTYCETTKKVTNNDSTKL